MDRARASAPISSASVVPASRLPPSDVPSAVTRLSRLLSSSGVGCVDLARAAGEWTGLGEGDPIRSALFSLAKLADATGSGNAYHNGTHMRDVLIAGMNVATADSAVSGPLTPRERGLLALACVAHDLDHDGCGNSVSPSPSSEKVYVPFRLEARAADAAAKAMREIGVPESDVVAVRGLILATDTIRGYAALRGEASKEDPAELSLVVSDPSLSRLAGMLRDSDLLFSAGLSPSMHDEQTSLLETELGLGKGSMGPKGAAFFLKNLAGGTFLSAGARAVFGDGMKSLVALNEVRLRSSELASLPLAAVERVSASIRVERGDGR
jgi:hypothetical protein